ncbi:hypothetical protein DKX38_002529 [Salix brachista]|uniref:Uncharacterized protein n=1 Tax=Salix brachista TaxID=2182728 RepID=A0A5N5NR55_9ROSI|nr:hypothetical protein DKX38_002529 [Salix brachista]
MDFVLPRAHLKDIVHQVKNKESSCSNFVPTSKCTCWSWLSSNEHPSDSLTCKAEEQDEYELKKSRLCGPIGPIEPECSSNITENKDLKQPQLNSNFQGALGEDGYRAT